MQVYCIICSPSPAEAMARKPRISAAILDIMRDGKRHAWTFEQLLEGLAERDLKPDFSALFRAVEKLVAGGALSKVLLEGGRTCVELASPHHDHLHCSRCDALVAVPCIFDQEAVADLEREAKIAISDHKVIFSGLCRECRSTASVTDLEGGVGR
jgi:Fur family transcriptional regulator, peroxide stress response regulator